MGSVKAPYYVFAPLGLPLTSKMHCQTKRSAKRPIIQMQATQNQNCCRRKFVHPRWTAMWKYLWTKQMHVPLHLAIPCLTQTPPTDVPETKTMTHTRVSCCGAVLSAQDQKQLATRLAEPIRVRPRNDETTRRQDTEGTTPLLGTT